MVGAEAHNHSSSAVLDIGEVEVEHLAGPQATLQHQQNHCPIAPRPEGTEQGLNVIALQRTGYSLRSLHTHDTSDGVLAAGRTDEGTVALRDARQRRIRPLLDWVLH